MPAKKKEEMSIENMLTRLDEIAAKLDSDLPLDEALSLYEEGVRLIKESERLIADAQARIMVLDPEKISEESADE